MSDVRSRSLLFLTSSTHHADSSFAFNFQNVDSSQPAFDQVVLHSVDRTPSTLRLESLATLGLDEFSYVGASDQRDESLLNELLSAASAVQGPRIIYSSLAVPDSIQQSLPVTFHELLRAATADDLLLLPVSDIKLADGRLTLAQILQNSNTRCDSLSRPVDASRLPHVGPKSLSLATDRRHRIHSEVHSLKLSSMSSCCVEAGLLLLNDYLNESHEISQTMEGKGNPKTGDYWHGIMHRREPDAGNASYWFRRVGHHPAMETLAANLTTWMTELQCSSQQIELAQQTVVKNEEWDAIAMVQLSTTALRSPGSNAEFTCRIVQYLEMLNLLSWTLVN